LRRLQKYLPLFVLFLAGCSGVSGFLVTSDGRLLVSVTIHPSFADPGISGGLVQFTASGNFNSDPTFVNSMNNVVWTVDQGPFNTIPGPVHATISPNGLAQCAIGFIGTVQVFATAPANPNLALSARNQVVGTARLNCP
jgi:hypothetical protein